MKSYFSRFLHHTMSHSGIREVFTSSLSLSDLIGESRSNKVANLSHLDYRVKPDNDNIGEDTPVKSECDSLCAGRSMVEMLGVLAIIGVLSVGAIAGYSKALFKYKLNKQTEQLNQLFNGITQYYKQFSSVSNLLPVLKKLNLVPVEMLKNNPSYIFDVFNNSLIASVAPCYDNNPDTCTILYYHITINNNQDIAVCRNVINTVKENSSDLYVVELLGNWGQEGETQYLFSGDAYCGKLGRKCLKEISIYDMEDMCNSAKGKNYTHLKVWWRY